ncbi:MAG: aminotransferase class III-fold pyridoxal phosphate-dependent enzyme [Bdellovibrionota bacterium]
MNSTGCGNNADMFRVQRYLEIIEENNLAGQNIHDQCLALPTRPTANTADANPQKISNVRGKGLMIAFDCVDPAHRNQVAKNMFAHGAIIFGCGDQSLRLRPHLDFSQDDVSKTIELIAKSL